LWLFLGSHVGLGLGQPSLFLLLLLFFFVLFISSASSMHMESITLPRLIVLVREAHLVILEKVKEVVEKTRAAIKEVVENTRAAIRQGSVESSA
jgi:hypothetical protein